MQDVSSSFIDKPRGRIEQDSEFEMTEFVGRKIKRIIAFQSQTTNVEIIAFLFSDSTYWHRCFLDAGIGFWEEYEADEAFREFDNCQRIDIVKQLSLYNTSIIHGACLASKQGTSRFEWSFPNGVLILRYNNESDIDSETLLELKLFFE